MMNVSLSEQYMKAIQESFTQLERKVHGKPLIYLDNAATTLRYKKSIEDLNQYYLMGSANVHRGVHLLSEEATTQYEQTRQSIQHFLKAKHHHEIIFTKGTTESINLVAQSLGEMICKPGDEIIISQMEHHSNIVPWQMLCEKKNLNLKVIPMTESGDLIFDEFKKLLNEKTKIISLVHISNTLGTVNPIKDYIDLGHQYGAKVLIDGAQAVAHLPVNVASLDADFYAFSGHKIFGPTGVGVLYGKEHLLEKMPPYHGGGAMIEKVSFEKTTYASLPHKFEAGTPHIAGVIGLKSAIDFVDQLGFETIMAHESRLLDYATEKLKTLPSVKLIGEAKEKSSVISFSMEHIHPHDIGTFCDQDGVAIRVGHHCTQPIMDFYKIPATARASVSIYNTKKDIDLLVKSLQKIMEFFS